MFLPGGRFEMQNAPVVRLIGRAYPSMRVLNAPSWVLNERYTIRGKAPVDATGPEFRDIVRALLVERFAFVGHQEMQPTQVYVMTTLRRDKRPGRWLVPRAAPCQADEKVKVPGFTPDASSIELRCPDDRVSPWSVQAAGISMPYFISILTSLVGVGAPVVDETGLAGTFDLRLRYSTNARQAPADAEWPSVFDALEEQLGLRLMPGQQERPVIVIDRIERPSDDAQ